MTSMRVLLVAAAVLCLIQASLARAAVVTVYSQLRCTGDSLTATVSRDGSCQQVTGGSVRLKCQEDGSFVYRQWDSSDCLGADTLIVGDPSTNAQSCVSQKIRVDCGSRRTSPAGYVAFYSTDTGCTGKYPSIHTALRDGSCSSESTTSSSSLTCNADGSASMQTFGTPDCSGPSVDLERTAAQGDDTCIVFPYNDDSILASYKLSCAPNTAATQNAAGLTWLVCMLAAAAAWWSGQR